MASARKKKRGRPPTGIRRPVITLRVHEDIYETIKRSAERGKLTLSEEAARTELLAKGPLAVVKYRAARPELEVMIVGAVARAVEGVLQKGRQP